MAKKGSFYKMKGHTLPGINQRSETTNMDDGRSKSSAFQSNAAAAGVKAGKGALAGCEKFGAINQLKNIGSKFKGDVSKLNTKMRTNFSKSNLGKDLKSVDTKLQSWGKKHSDWKANKMSTSKINIKDDMAKKYGTGKYAKGGSLSHKAMKPGESKYKYDVRMRKADNKFRKNDPLLNEIKKSQVHGPKTLSQHINEDVLKTKDGKWVNGDGSSTSFKTAFSTARKSHGGDGGTFEWKGKKYSTNIKKTSKPKMKASGNVGGFQNNPEKPNFGAHYRVPPSQIEQESMLQKKKSAAKKKKSPAKNYKKGYYGVK